MRTLFVVSERRVKSHVGEEYDSIMEVEDQPTTNTIQTWADRIKGRVRALWMEQKQAEDKDPNVAVTVDGATPYGAIVCNLQIIMKAEEGIVVTLPQADGKSKEVHDSEAQSLLSKMDANKR